MSRNYKPTQQMQAKAQYDSSINLVSEGSLDDYNLEKQLLQELNEQRIKIQAFKKEIHENIEKLQKAKETLYIEMKSTQQRLSELRNKKINTQMEKIKPQVQISQVSTSGLQQQKNNKQEQPIKQKKEIKTEQAKGLKQTQQQTKPESYGQDFRQRKYGKGEDKNGKDKERNDKTDCKKPFTKTQNEKQVNEEELNVQKNNRSMILSKSEADTQTVSLPLGYNSLEKIQMQCRITEKTPSQCLINHQSIELYIQEYQTSSSISLSLKCFCGKKLCQYHIIEPRNRIFFQSIMEKQLEVLIQNQPHLKCQSNSCNFKVIYNANLGQIQSHYYCPMCNEKCPFHFIV